MSTRNVIYWLIGLVMIGGGSALVISSLNQGQQDTVASTSNPGGFSVPKIGDARNAQDDGGPGERPSS